MNMQFKISLTLVIAVIVMMAGCGGTEVEVTTNVANANVANTNAAPPAGNAALDPIKKPQASTTNEAPTLTPVVHGYYDGLKKKDAAGVRKVMAQEFIKSVETDMKDENKTDLVAFLTEFDKLPEGRMEVRNEQISGARGVAEIKGGTYTNWTPIVFLNEGGSWKISNEVPRP